MQVAFNPKVLLPLSHIGEQDEFRVQDASSFCAMGEELSYWELLVGFCDSIILCACVNLTFQKMHRTPPSVCSVTDEVSAAGLW